MARILIAEDDRTSQTLAYRFIQQMGHAPFVSPDGKHAYEALKAANNFDLLLTDIMMPRMNGQDLIQTLRGDTEFMKLPIIIMSAVVGVRDIANLLQLGATLFLPKPIEFDELQELVARCLK